MRDRTIRQSNIGYAFCFSSPPYSRLITINGRARYQLSTLSSGVLESRSTAAQVRTAAARLGDVNL
jgi:hypothetical protein